MSDHSTYASSGVNIELGDDASRVLFEAAKVTWQNREGILGEVVAPLDDFSGLRMINVGGLPQDSYMCLGFDGIGTKVEIAERIGKHDTMAYDLIAMVCDDAVVRGGEPVVVGSILDVNSLGTDNNSRLEQVKQLAKGYIDAAKVANVAIINGELAELGDRIAGHGDFHYNWGSGLIWFAKKDRLFTGNEVQVGDSIIGLKETGFRSNGLSLVRKIMKDAHGDNWHTENVNGKNLGEQTLIPSRIYCGAVCDMFGGFDKEAKAVVHGVAHITGGGVPGKIGRILKATGYGATIDNAFEPGDILKYAQQKGNVQDAEAYKTWNMGQGMVVVSPDPENVMKVASQHNIESQVIGTITKEPGIRITSQGIASQGETLHFEI
jgi:phosphoribosylformylglycinamidine cyclo-ligase